MSDAVERAVARLAAAYGSEAAAFLESAARSAPSHERAVHRLEEWLGRNANPAAVVAAVQERPSVARLLAFLLASGGAVANSIVQNPELGVALLDPESWARPPTLPEIEQDARALLAGATSPRHGHDRLRHAKQRWTAMAAIAEVAGAWQPEEVWRALSDVAEVLARLALEWMEPSSSAELGIVVWGKLGGRELNISSDIDLMLVAKDEDASARLTAVAERYARAVAERMGRGALYRVDFRLRPFGSRGPLVPSRAAVEAYYGRYSEPWEALAAVRSRALGEGEFADWWTGVRDEAAFREARSEPFVESLLEVRRRIEESCGPQDFKGGPGGIRDVEFYVQILQLLHGSRLPELRGLGTLPALRRLEAAGVVDRRSATVLGHGYTFLREMEHRCQLWSDQPARALPSDPETLAWIAKGMGYERPEGLVQHYETERSDIRYTFESRFGTSQPPPEDRLGPLAERAMPVLERLLGKEAANPELWRALRENESSHERAVRLAATAPAYVQEIALYPSLVESILSGEILEPAAREAPSADIDAWAKGEWARCLARQALSDEPVFCHEAAELGRKVLRAVMSELAPGLTVASLGSFSTCQVGLSSDLDVVFLGPDDADDAPVEQVVGRWQQAKTAGLRMGLDLRLRPEGRKGRLVVTPESLARYAERAMEDWERLAWGRARLVYGDGAQVAGLLATARSGPLDRCRAESLLAMRRRIQAERIPVAARSRHVKLSPGTLADIDWIAEMAAWRASVVPGPEDPATTAHRLQSAGPLLRPGETEALLDAERYYLLLRFRLASLGFPDDVVPENPDKLEALARLQCATDGNAVLHEFATHAARVSSVFEDVVSRF